MAVRINIALSALVILALALTCSAGHFGGLDEEREVDDHVRSIVLSVMDDLLQRSSVRYLDVRPISYRRQVVAGHNYFIKAIAMGEDGLERIIHLRIYRPIDGRTMLSSIREDMDRERKLEYFD